MNAHNKNDMAHLTYNKAIDTWIFNKLCGRESNMEPYEIQTSARVPEVSKKEKIYSLLQKA